MVYKQLKKIANYFATVERWAMIQKVLYHKSLEWYYKNDLFRNDTLIIDLKELMDLNENNYNLDAMKKEDIYIKMVINLIIINWLQIR